MSRTNKFTIEQQKDIVDLYIKDRLSAVLISKKFNTTTTTITSILKRNNIQIRPKSISISEHWNRFKQEDRFEEYRKNLSKRQKNKIVSIESREKMSKSRSEGIAQGRI